MMQEAVKFSKAKIIGLEIASPTYLAFRQVIPRVGTSSVPPWKRAGRKEFYRTPSTGRNAYPIYGVTCWTKYHSCWRGFCRPA